MNIAFERIKAALESTSFFYAALALFAISSVWIAVTSIYPMAFDEEFHYGLIRIYASTLLPFGIEHTGDMAQYGAATADASYLFHYLLSFPYRVLDVLGLPDMAIIILLRLLNVAFVVGSLLIFRRAVLEAGVSKITANIGVILATLLPVFVLLAAHINYDNLLLLVVAWCVLLIVRLTNAVRRGQALPLPQSVQLVCAVLIGMSIKYAFLPLALGLFLWIVWLMVIGYRRHKQTITSQIKSYTRQWQKLRRQSKYLWIGIIGVSIFFASHYLTNTLTYGSPIPSCERVFSESECVAYGPWNRNKLLEASKNESFEPLSYPVYVAREWFPGMTQRLTFAVAGKTNDFETKLPLPALVYSLVTLALIGVFCLIFQIGRRNEPWLTWFTLLLIVVYVGVLSFQLYGDYVDTAEPVAINGRYLIPLLPLVSVVLIAAIRDVLKRVDSRMLAGLSVVLLLLVIVSGGGAGTYIVLSDSHWFWPGFGQQSHASLQDILTRFTLPYRY